MNTWALPAAAAAFWAGLLAWEVRPPWARPWMGIVVGLAGLARRVAGRASNGDRLRPAHHHGARRARAGGRRRGERSAGCRRVAARRDRARHDRSGRARRRLVRGPCRVARRLVARSSRAATGHGRRHAAHRSRGRRVRMARHARRHARRVARRGRVPARVAVAERRRRPAGVGARRRDLRRGHDPSPRRPRVPGRARAQRHGRRAEREPGRAPRAVSEPVHPCGTGVPGVRRPVDRAALPGEGGGAAARARARRRLPTGPGDDARLPGERPRPSARGLRRERRDGPGADRRAGLAAAAHPMAAVRSGRRHGGLLRRDDRRRAVGDARGGDGHDRARGRADRQTARHRLGPGGRGPGAPGPGSVARVVDRVPALGDGHGRHGGAGVADRRAAAPVPAGARRARRRDHARRAARRDPAPAVPLP